LASPQHTGHWGDLEAEDKTLNDAALVDGSRILRDCTTRKGVTIWIITEAVNYLGLRYSTCVLIPSED
jgi:hypothetical protein